MMTSLFFDSTYSFKCSVAETRFTLAFKLHLSLLIHSTKTLSVADNIVHISYIRTFVDKSLF